MFPGTLAGFVGSALLWRAECTTRLSRKLRFGFDRLIGDISKGINGFLIHVIIYLSDFEFGIFVFDTLNDIF
jgi:hypothetical protein